MRSGRADGGSPSGAWFFSCHWRGRCRSPKDGSPGVGNRSSASTPHEPDARAQHEVTLAVPLDRQVDAWLASLRAQGYSARQLEYRAAVLGRWAAGVSMQSEIPRAVVAFLAWGEAQRVQRLGSP